MLNDLDARCGEEVGEETHCRNEMVAVRSRRVQDLWRIEDRRMRARIEIKNANRLTDRE